MRLDELIQQPEPKQLLTQAVIKAMQNDDLNYESGEVLHHKVQSLINNLAAQYGQSPGPWLNDVFANVLQWYTSRPPL